jgi:hypothetical protein
MFGQVWIVTISAMASKDTRPLSSRTDTSPFRPRLIRRSINALLKGRYAHVGGATIAARARNLVTIASAYSWDELLEEPGIGAATAAEIRLWLEERGASLRQSS